jgi:hypothetical protein
MRKLERRGQWAGSVVDVVVGCHTRSFRLEARGSPSVHGRSASQQLRKPLRSLSFDLLEQTDLLLHKLIRA